MNFDVKVIILDEDNSEVVNISTPAHNYEHALIVLLAIATVMREVSSANTILDVPIHSNGNNVEHSVHAESHH